MISLAAIRDELGIEAADTSDDVSLQRFIRNITARVRQRAGRPIVWLADSIDGIGALTRVRSYGHGLCTGETVKILGTSTTPVIDGDHVISVDSPDTFTINADITVNGTYATIHPKVNYTFAARNSDRLFVPAECLPWASLDQVSIREDATTWDVVDSAHYELSTNDRLAQSVELIRTDGYWDVETSYVRHQWALRRVSRYENVNICYYAGCRFVPPEIDQAVTSLVCDLYESQGGPMDLASTSFEGVDSRKMRDAERRSHLLSPESIIQSWAVRKF